MPFIRKEGRLMYLRISEVGDGFGPPEDFIDVEVVVRLDKSPGEAYGFQLRSDEQGLAHQGMLDVLRDAFAADRSVFLDVLLEEGKENGRLRRVLVTR
jgi:hypothetical protein